MPLEPAFMNLPIVSIKPKLLCTLSLITKKTAKMGSREKNGVSFFQMPLHYPRYSKKEYLDMPEWKLDQLLAEYGLSTHGDLDYKREFAMGAFLWPELQHHSNYSSPYHHHSFKHTSSSSNKKTI